MTWGEAWRLTLVLAGDASSQLGASLAGLSRPVTFADQALVVLANNYVEMHTQRLPRLTAMPDPQQAAPVRHGAGTAVPVEDFRRIIAEHRGEVVTGV